MSRQSKSLVLVANVYNRRVHVCDLGGSTAFILILIITIFRINYIHCIQKSEQKHYRTDSEGLLRVLLSVAGASCNWYFTFLQQR